MGNRVAGSFQVYAPQPGFFEENEIGLLTQVSSEISFALTAIAEFTARQRAEEQLRKLSLAVEQSPVSILITDVTGAIEYVNPKFIELTGYTADEVRGKNPRLLKSGEMPAGSYQQLWQTITQGRQWHGEFHNRKKNGELFWESASISPIKTADGRITHFVAIKDDITGRKQAEQALLESEERFRKFTEAAMEGICISDNGRICYVNDQILKMSGYERDELVGQFIVPLVAPGSRAAVAEAIRTGEEKRLEVELLRKDGSAFFAETQIKMIRIGNRQLRLAATHDITRHKQLEAALRQSQQRYLLAEHAVNDGLWDWNILTDEDYFSPRWKEIIGYRDDKLPNHKSSFLKNIHPDDRAVVDAVTRAHLEKGQRYAFEFRLRHKDGSYRWVFSRGEAQRDPAGRPVRMIGAITDITERKLAEKKLQEAGERFQLVTRATNDAIWDRDLINPAWWNDAFYEVFGFDRNTPPSPEAWASHIHPDDRERVLARIRAAAEHGETAWVDEFRFQRADGAYSHVFHRSFSVRDASGKIVRMLGSMMDITERKRAEQDLHEAVERFQLCQPRHQRRHLGLGPDQPGLVERCVLQSLWLRPKPSPQPRGLGQPYSSRRPGAGDDSFSRRG